MMLQLTKEKETYVADLAAFHGSDEGAAAPAWLKQRRRDAAARFQELPFPTTRDEDWKYTRVAPILEARFRTGGFAHRAVEDIILPPYTRGTKIRLVFVNGKYQPTLSSRGNAETGVLAGALSGVSGWLADLAEEHLAQHARPDFHAFAALNTAFLDDAAIVYVPPGAELDDPIHLIFVAASLDEPSASHPRALIVAGSEATASVVETYVSLDAERSFSNAVSEVVLEAGARLHHHRILIENDDSFHLSLTQVRQGRDSRFASHVVSFGGGLVRNDLNVLLGAEGAECALDGLYVAGGSQHVDNHTSIDHASLHCTSRELYKGVLDGKSRAVFNGKVMVRERADGTDARQTNRNLILSDEALVNTKPQLEILADDVKCSHGAAIGQLDEDQVFYLKSRGMGDERARALLVHGFAAEVVREIGIEPVRREIDRLLAERLSTEVFPRSPTARPEPVEGWAGGQQRLAEHV